MWTGLEVKEEEIMFSCKQNEPQKTYYTFPINMLIYFYNRGASNSYNVHTIYTMTSTALESYEVIYLISIKTNLATHTQGTYNPQRKSRQSSPHYLLKRKH